MSAQTAINLAELAEIIHQRCTQLITDSLQAIPSLTLKEALAYSLRNSGKQLRPLLIYATGLTLGATLEGLDRPACAVELIHTYSLIHDDLPCMDNADLRRGQPTVHKVYTEGMAVLTGDALHTLAMQIMVSPHYQLDPARRLQMLAVLTEACGPYGMAAGQAMDITVMADPGLSLATLREIYQLKTGAMFSACVELGRLASPDNDAHNRQALTEFGQLIGLAFQIQDDLLDIEASTDQLGKPQGQDHQNRKVTWPQLVGVKAARDQVSHLYEQALATLVHFGERAQLLRALAATMLNRDH